jgi:hypothetical protein
MIAPPPGVRIWLAAGVTDMRKGFDGLATLVQQQLRHHVATATTLDGLCDLGYVPYMFYRSRRL